MTTKLYDLTFDIDGENIMLEQSAGVGESAYITLHKSHLFLLAQRAGIIDAPPPMPSYTATADDCDELHHLEVVSDEDGTINLYQTRLHGMGGSDEHITLHRAQAIWLGSRLLCLARRAQPTGNPDQTHLVIEKRTEAVEGVSASQLGLDV
mgnify:CR=1 FL=1